MNSGQSGEGALPPAAVRAGEGAVLTGNAWGDPGLWLTALLVLLAAAVPVLTGSAVQREGLFLVLLYVVLCSSLNLLMGYTGYVNFAHIVFFGLGGYAGFYLMAVQGWHLIPAMLGAALLVSLLAAALGVAVLRLRGSYFALATIGVIEAVRALVANLDLVGGATGMSLDFRRYADYGGPTAALWLAFFLLALLALIGVLLSYAVKTSRFGLGLMAIREDEDAAQVLGIPAPRLKALAFVLSAVLPAMAGTLFFFKNGNIEPGDAFRLNMAIEGIVMVMLGGYGTVLGPVLGAGAYAGLRGYLLTSPLFKDLQLAVAGLLLLLIVLFVPTGLLGLLRRRLPALGRRLP
jgi:branched-chain amino acid transport system permease protein